MKMVRKQSSAQLLKSLSLADLQELLEKKVAEDAKRVAVLKTKRAKIAEQLAQVENDIAVIEGPASSAAPKKIVRKKGKKARTKRAAKKTTAKKVAAKKSTRTGGKLTIPQAIAQVLKAAGKPQSVKEIRETILAQKLISKISKSFGVQVAIALSKRDEFKRVGKGTYTM
jgi:HB1/ASXL restriction endonuclease-like protein with HTH domain